MRFRTPVTVMSIAALTTILAACADTDQDSTGQDGTGKSSHAEHSTAEVSGEYNDADIEYVSGMIVHHQQAVGMSDILLEQDDVDQDISALAEDIRAAQQPEIEQMESWLQAWGHEADDDGDHGGHDEQGDAHEGMMSEEDLAELEAAAGEDASRLFLEQMIVHHEGAVSMAEDHLTNGENPDALRLSEEIINVQQAEIEQMEGLLEDL